MPLLFVLMSGRKAKDYRAIFRAIKELVDVNPQEVVVDYERAVFKAVREKFPMTKLKGCAFHANRLFIAKLLNSDHRFVILMILEPRCSAVSLYR